MTIMHEMNGYSSQLSKKALELSGEVELIVKGKDV